MKKYLLLALLGLSLSINVFAGTLDGEWKGTNANGKISRIIISGNMVHGYGQCPQNPKGECDWGRAISVYYINEGNTLVAEFNKEGKIEDEKEGALYHTIVFNVTHNKNKLKSIGIRYWSKETYPVQDPEGGMLVVIDNLVRLD